ncbi:hypothetical protein [Metabacillus sp. RGM 3146]|uniref:hypothetical protein n=1 Tax=Metabacillus sp. RGM 3146 TaxID=3401092 RepID=UPI003B9D839B
MELDKEKRKRLVQPRQALEKNHEKSGFDFLRFFEATRGARRWSWTKKSGSALFSPDKHLSENPKSMD